MRAGDRKDREDQDRSKEDLAVELVIVSGMSGAGKSRAAAALEDLGFYCIDNMPPALIPKFAEICFQTGGKLEHVALVTDVRGIHISRDFFDGLAGLKESGFDYKMLFLDASDAALISRYKETRRRHPLSEMFHGSLSEAIQYERGVMQKLRDMADYVIDTTKLSPTQLRDHIMDIFAGGDQSGFVVNVMSFGFKYGSPADADLVFDVRCLPNPFYVPELRDKTGLNEPVYDYVFSFDESRTLFEKIADLVRYLIPLYIEEGKAQLIIAFGCTGGKHRSVSFAERLNDYINDQHLAYSVATHRDIGKN